MTPLPPSPPGIRGSDGPAARSSPRRIAFRCAGRRRSPDPAARALSLILIASGVLLLAGVGFASSRPSSPPPPPRATPARFPVTLEIYSSGGLDNVVPLTLRVPVDTPIEFTIYNFDTAQVGAPMANAAVAGTFTGPVDLSGADAPDGPASGLAPRAVSHTFTSDSGPYLFNVPIPAAVRGGLPALATFTLIFNETGHFTWFCAAFCDDGGHGGTGEMGGQIVVGSN